MQSLKGLIFDYAWSIWRRRWYAVAVSWVICAAGWVFVYQMPNRYESSARLYMNTDQALNSLLRGLTVDDNEVSRLDRMQRTLLSTTNMKHLIRLTGMDAQNKNEADAERMIAHLQSSIAIKLQTRNLFTISYSDANPVLAQNVVSNLLSIFMESTAGDSRTDINSAQRFLQAQLDRLETALRAAEKKKSEFQTQYYDLLPGAGSNVSLLEQNRTAVQQLGEDLSDAIAQRDSLQKEIAQIPADDAFHMASTLPGNDSGLSLSPETRLIQLKTELETASATMKAEHPVVVALQHRIDAVSAQIASNENSKKNKAGLQSVNPLYRDLKMKLVDQETKIASLRRRLDSAEESRDKIEQEAKRAPGVGAQYINIDRDYEVIKKNYDELLVRRESARISEDADKKGDKVDVRTIDAPEIPNVPIGPNRILYFSLVLAGGILAGIATAFLLTELDSSFSNTTALQLFGLPVLGSISLQPNFVIRKKHWFLRGEAFGSACAVLFLAYAGILLATVSQQARV